MSLRASAHAGVAIPYRFAITTGVAEPCSVAVENITIGGPYSIRELYDYDSTYIDSSFLSLPDFIYCLMWYEIVTLGEPYKIYCRIFTTEDVESDPDSAEQELMRTATSDLESYLVQYDSEMIVWCCVIDDRGNLSDIYRTDPFTFNIEDNRDVSELAEVIDRIRGVTRSNEVIFNEFKSVLSPEKTNDTAIEIIPVSPVR